jgi:hypothetical protein
MRHPAYRRMLDPQHESILSQIVELNRTILAAKAQDVAAKANNLPFDLPRRPETMEDVKIEPAPPLRAELPAPAMGDWDAGLVKDVTDAAIPHGLEAYGVLATIAHESHAGRRWDLDSGYAALERQHGVEGAKAILADARAAAAKLPKRAFDWLEESGFADNPAVVTPMALAWRHRRGRPGDEPHRCTE